MRMRLPAPIWFCLGIVVALLATNLRLGRSWATQKWRSLSSSRPALQGQISETWHCHTGATYPQRIPAFARWRDGRLAEGGSNCRLNRGASGSIVFVFCLHVRCVAGSPKEAAAARAALRLARQRRGLLRAVFSALVVDAPDGGVALRLLIVACGTEPPNSEWRAELGLDGGLAVLIRLLVAAADGFREREKAWRAERSTRCGMPSARRGERAAAAALTDGSAAGVRARRWRPLLRAHLSVPWAASARVARWLPRDLALGIGLCSPFGRVGDALEALSPFPQ